MEPHHTLILLIRSGLLKYEGKARGKLHKATKAGLPSPLKFTQCGQSGLSISESLPNLSMIADDLCVIRSMHCDVPNHEPAEVSYSRLGHQLELGRFMVLERKMKICRAHVVDQAQNCSRSSFVGAGFLPAQYQASVSLPKTCLWTNCLQISRVLVQQKRTTKAAWLLAQMNQLHNQSG